MRHIVDAFFHRHLSVEKNVVPAHAAKFLLRFGFIANERPDFSPEHGIADVARFVHIEDHDGDFVIHTKAERGRIHDLQSFRERFSKSNAFVEPRIRLGIRIAIVKSRVRVRSNRRTALDEAKKLKAAGKLTEDELRDVEEEVQKLTDRFVKSIDEHLKHKEAEIMKV